MTARRPLGGAVLTALLLTLACAAADREAPASPVSADRSTRDDRARILRAEDRREVDDALLKLLADDRPVIRALAVRALGRIGDRSRLTELEAALADDAPEVRATAAFALGLLDDPEAGPALIDASRDVVPLVRERVARALGLLEVEEAKEALRRLIGDTDADVSAAACHATVHYRPADFAVDDLVLASRSTERRQARAAVYALSRTASRREGLLSEPRRRAWQRLLELAPSVDPEIRILVASGFYIPTVNEVEILGKMIQDDPDPRVRAAATSSICFPSAPLEPFVSEALEDDDARVVLAAVNCLAAMKGPDVFEAALNVIVFDERLWLRTVAIDAIGKIDNLEAVRVANGLSLDPHPLIRAATARLVSGRQDGDAIAIAARLAEDPTPRVKAAAIPAVAGATGPLETLLAGALDSREEIILLALVRAASARLDSPDLDDGGIDDALSIVERAWAAAEGDAAWNVQFETAQAASSAASDRAARALAERALTSPFRAVRQRAIELFSDRFGEDRSAAAIVASDRPLDFYRDVLRWAERPRAAIVAVARPGFVPGNFTLRLDTRNAPLTSWNFAELARAGFLDRRRIHRFVPNFVVQDGDPLGDGSGGPGYAIRDEWSATEFPAGTLGMATAGKDTGGSQWFITMTDQPRLGGRYTAFGEVVQNFPGVVSLLLPGDLVLSVRVVEGDGTEMPETS